jgi:hypothetical protein
MKKIELYDPNSKPKQHKNIGEHNTHNLCEHKWKKHKKKGFLEVAVGMWCLHLILMFSHRILFRPLPRLGVKP